MSIAGLNSMNKLSAMIYIAIALLLHLPAWCYILPKSKKQDLLFNLFAYNVWSYLSMILLVIFFIVTTCYTCRVVSIVILEGIFRI